MVRYGFASQHPTTLFVDVHLLNFRPTVAGQNVELRPNIITPYSSPVPQRPAPLILPIKAESF